MTLRNRVEPHGSAYPEDAPSHPFDEKGSVFDPDPAQIREGIDAWKRNLFGDGRDWFDEARAFFVRRPSVVDGRGQVLAARRPRSDGRHPFVPARVERVEPGLRRVALRDDRLFRR